MAKKPNPFAKKSDKDAKKKKGDDKAAGENLPPWLKKGKKDAK